MRSETPTASGQRRKAVYRPPNQGGPRTGSHTTNGWFACVDDGTQKKFKFGTAAVANAWLTEEDEIDVTTEGPIWYDFNFVKR